MKFYKTFYITNTLKNIIYIFFTVYINSFNKRFIYLHHTI